MKSFALGKSTSHVEIQEISKHGIWIYVMGREYFLSYKDYPGFKEAKVSEICNVQFLHGLHLHWPDLDVDLEVEALEYPEKYPLIYH
jgi:hypothetical protein